MKIRKFILEEHIKKFKGESFISLEDFLRYIDRIRNDMVDKNLGDLGEVFAIMKERAGKRLIK